ncbi:thiol reductant ABC exporter subunit CydD [Sinomonas atrocyanea]|uniref:thiol reductant ABC exporter subunit CydD n=1 Tax=Sinomonas atrocyanea TaxID=37927 RepID=UPI00277E5D94|nr:thiol reductant ABC exporter subunit CydD [Sinomonas atrocyanea]MDQ0260013.1 ATP-binding cassette subfamily C protein CydCD [Sinomonas atrocyanea]MDR6620034.1 ATP-binding cassette subfamily C protein CydCD [Sinomonas atrocyanea]
MRPDIPLGPTSRRALVLLGVLAAAKAVGLALLAQGVASGLAALAAGAPQPGTLSASTLAAAAGVLIRAAAEWGTSAVGRWAAVGVKEELRSQLLEAGLGGGPASVSPGDPADDGAARVASSPAATAVLAGRGLDGLDALYTQYLPALVQTAVLPLLVGARILGADWVSALILVLTLPLVPVFMVLIGRHTLEAVAEAQQSLLRLGAHLVELAQGLPVLVGLGRAAEQRRALGELSRAYRSRTMATLRVAFLSALALELISTISVAVVAVFIGIRLVHGDMTLEAGLLALILAPECFQPLRDLGTAHHASEDGAEALRRARARIGAPRGAALLSTGRRDGDDAPGTPEAAGPSEVRVTALAVQYDGAAGAVGPVDFTAPAGRVTVLAGPSGSGKTTVLAAIAGLVRDGAGAAVHGSVHGPDPRRVAWVPQHPQFTERTVAAELLLYAGAAGEDAAPGEHGPLVGELLARLGLGGLGAADPAELSPGQQRRVAVARGLARVADGADLLLLDEPTAHLDDASAALVERAVSALAGRVTVLLVSHEPRTAALADRTVELAPSSSAASARFRAEVPDAPARRVPPAPAAVRPGAWLRTLASLLRPDAGTYARAALAGLGAAAAAVALSTLSGWLIVRASEQPPILYLLTAITGVRFFGIARAVLRYRERLALHSAVLSTLTVLRERLWTLLSARGLSARRLLVPGAALEALVGDAEAVRDQLPRVLAPITTAVLVAAGALAAVGILLPAQTPVLAAAVAVALLVAPAVARAADRRAAARVQTGRAGLLARMGQALAAGADLRANARDGAVLRSIRSADAALTRLERRGAAAEGLARAVVVAATGTAAALTLGAAQGAGAPAATAAAVLLLQLALGEPLAAASTAVQQLPALRAALVRVAAEERAVQDAVERRAASSGTPEPGAPARGAGLGLRGVTAGWGGGPDVLTHLDLTARPGDWVVVAGPSGSGKSTLLALLTGFLAPREGTAEVAGPVAWCPQESHLFDSTVRGNLAVARDRDHAPSDAELEAVLAKVGLLEHVRSLPGGLDARIGSRGAFLSGGQRQRLAVARTLLAGAEVVLLDEPTAHLDPESGLALVAALHEALVDRTVVMVTHHATELMPGDVLVRLAAPQAAVRAAVPVG